MTREYGAYRNMIRLGVVGFFMFLLAAVPGASSGQNRPGMGEENERSGASADRKEVKRAIEEAEKVAEELIREYKPTNDAFVLKCLRSKKRRLDALRATLNSGGEDGQTGEETGVGDRGRDARCRQFPAFCSDAPSAGDGGGSELQVIKQVARQVEEECRACLRISDGEVVSYSAADAQGPPSPLPDVPGIEDPVVIEPEPIDRLLSDVEQP